MWGWVEGECEYHLGRNFVNHENGVTSVFWRGEVKRVFPDSLIVEMTHMLLCSF